MTTKTLHNLNYIIENILEVSPIGGGISTVEKTLLADHLKNQRWNNMACIIGNTLSESDINDINYHSLALILNYIEQEIYKDEYISE